MTLYAHALCPVFSEHDSYDHTTYKLPISSITQPRAAATLCRAQVGECDLPEFCLGDNPACPSDVFLQDGLQCGNGQVRGGSYLEQGRGEW
ncbi:hypothetical protein DPMN_163644 [Dreissena polymorpha]|uniref:Disintegrin domain-containing protein n=1 Tax=Dreissena polymorpha TaxID=45954 RepID=A0A9D4IVC8_DREPO|nr:hypothetical protein DPMN_163644 [Dreissena polymorpha]